MVSKAALIFAACLVLFVAVHLCSTMLVQESVGKDRRHIKVRTIIISSVHFVNHLKRQTITAMQTLLKKAMCRCSETVGEIFMNNSKKKKDGKVEVLVRASTDSSLCPQKMHFTFSVPLSRKLVALAWHI